MITLFELFHYMHSADIKKRVLIQQRTRKSVSVVIYKSGLFCAVRFV